jgi:hypothetical protein
LGVLPVLLAKLVQVDAITNIEWPPLVRARIERRSLQTSEWIDGMSGVRPVEAIIGTEADYFGADEREGIENTHILASMANGLARLLSSVHLASNPLD